jgi:hypothetical protein
VNGPQSLTEPVDVAGTDSYGLDLGGRQIRLHGPITAIQSHVGRQENQVQHSFGCALPARGGCCDCFVTKPVADWCSGNEWVRLLVEGFYFDGSV